MAEEVEDKKEEVSEPVKVSNKEENVAMAIVAYFIFFIPLLTDDKNDPFVKYHVKQGLVLLIAWVVLWVVSFVLAFIPVIGWILAPLLYLAVFILWIMGIINAAQKKQKPVPIIGQFGEKFNF
jgi:uncharacterized membrane protein